MLHRTIRAASPPVRVRLPFFRALLVALAAAAPQTPAQTTVYRCTDPSGGIELRQTRCTSATREQKLTVEDRRTGWVPPQPTDSPAPKKSERSRRKSQESPDESKLDPKQTERCWKKGKQLEEVNWKLRHGYESSEGVKLRRRRTEYEEYRRRYCSTP